jgi:predicted permease
MEFYAAFKSILMLIIIMAAGYFLRKKHYVGDEASSVLSSLEVKIFLPALSFSVFSQNFTKDAFVFRSTYVLWGFIIVIISFCISVIIARIYQKKGQLHDIIVYAVAIPNIGYIGYPMIEAVWGGDALFSMMIFCIPHSIAIYTVGMYILNPNKVLNFKTIFNPTIIAMILGMIVGYFNIRLPELVLSTVLSLKACMAPVAMLLTGIVMARQPILKLLNSFKMYILAVIKNIIMPLVIGLILYISGVRGELFMVAVASVAMPMGLNSVVFPEAFGGDGTAGAQSCFISNLLALISLPLTFYFINVLV